MKRWRRVVPLCMAVSMAALTPAQILAAESPEFAHTAEEWETLRDNKMEYGEIEGLVHEYNPVVLNNRLSYNTSEYKNKNSNEIADMMRDAANAARSAANASGSDDALADVSYYSSEASAKAYEQQADSNTMDDLVMRLQYEMAERTLAGTVQSLLSQYNQMLNTKEVLVQSRELAAAASESAKTRKNLGMATQADVLDAEQQVQKLDAQLISMDSAIVGLKQNLCIMTGWSYDSNPEIGTIPDADMGRIDSMNLETDIKTATENNYGLKISRRKLENTTFSYDDAEILRKSISNDEQNLATGVTKQYQAVVQAKADYEEAVAAFDLENKNYQSANLKYQLGTIGRLEFLQVQNAFVSKQADKVNKNMQLFQAIETYGWMLRGVSSSAK